MDTENTQYIEKIFQNIANENVLINYSGPFNYKVSVNLLTVFKKHLNQFPIPLLLKKKVYNVMVESMDNLCKHNNRLTSGKNELPFPAVFILEKDKSDFIITTGNLINHNQVESLKIIFNRINAMSNKEIAELYKSIIINETNSAESEPGIGLLDIAIKSGNKLDHHFTKVDDSNVFFVFKIRISN